jgi:methylmalonyl-CoA/ethylmalonyl-CoA epimerase
MKLHHIGKVVENLEKEAEYYRDLFNLATIGDAVFDPIQKVEVLLLTSTCGNAPLIELVRPVGPESPVARFLQKGGGLHHLCFEVEDIQKAIEESRSKGGIILGEVVPGKAHQDSPTVWVYTKQKELVEFIQAGAKPTR